MKSVSDKCGKRYNFKGHTYTCYFEPRHGTMHEGERYYKGNGWIIASRLAWSDNHRITNYKEHITRPYPSGD